jgi:hypothetical protein
MGIRSKKDMCVLTVRVLTDYEEKTYEQINMERVLRGEDEIILTPNYIFSRDGVAWLLGFTFSDHAIGCQEFEEALVSCFKRGWFDFCMKSEDTQELLLMFLTDLLVRNKEMYEYIADRFILKFPETPLSKKLVSLSWSFGFTKIKYNELCKLKTGLTFPEDGL